MKKLDAIKLAIYEKNMAGEISNDDKDVLLEAAEAKYADEQDDQNSDDAITFSEAVEAINDILDERTGMVSEACELSNEGIAATKLRVFEAAMEGSITNEEKKTFLEYLDESNYR